MENDKGKELTIISTFKVGMKVRKTAKQVLEEMSALMDMGLLSREAIYRLLDSTYVVERIDEETLCVRNEKTFAKYSNHYSWLEPLSL